MTKSVEFWYEFASTYSYLSVMRIEEEAAKRGLIIKWRPFLLGPIFQSQGWNNSPFNIYPAKGTYMWRDMERLCSKANLAYKKPAIFPANGLKAARLAWLGERQEWCPQFTRAVYTAQFADGRNISDPEVLGDILQDLGLDKAETLEQINSPEVKDGLKAQTSEAMKRGLFGAPSFTIETEIFWGNDRLEDALDWALR